MVVVLSVTFQTLLHSSSLGNPLQGHVTIDMESIYYKNEAPIPISIQITVQILI